MRHTSELQHEGWSLSRFALLGMLLLGALLPRPSAATVKAPSLAVGPELRLPGAPVEIRIEGLQPGRTVTVSASRFSSRRQREYRSAATFIADPAGTVDLSRDAPVAGPWAGVDPRGLFWSMKSVDAEIESETPWSVARIAADVDADGVPDLEAEVDLRASIAVERFVKIPMGEAHPGAFLMRPEGSDPLPVVIALGGSEGGDRSARFIAPRLAAHGYAVLGLPYYSPGGRGSEPQFPDLPQAFNELPLEKLEQARDWLLQRDDVDHEHIGVWGVSKGAEFALAGASRIEGFAAIAAIVPSDVNWQGWGVQQASSSFSWRGEALPFVPYLGMSQEFDKGRRGQAIRLRLPHDAGRLANSERAEAGRIAVEQIAAPVLVVGGDEDNTWDSGGMARNIAERREAAGLETVLFVDTKTGHFLSGEGIDPDPEADAKLQARAFVGMLEFFGRYLKE